MAMVVRNENINILCNLFINLLSAGGLYCNFPKKLKAAAILSERRAASSFSLLPTPRVSAVKDLPDAIMASPIPKHRVSLAVEQPQAQAI